MYEAQVRGLEPCFHLRVGAPHLTPYSAVPFGLSTIPLSRTAWNSLGRDVSSLRVLYRLFNGECSEGLFGVVPLSQFDHRTRWRLEFTYFMDAWDFSSTCGSRSFLPYVCKFWNRLPSAVSPERYKMGPFKRGVNRFLLSQLGGQRPRL